MQTQLADWIRNTPEGETAEAILRKCVHCGFCNATCPTYQLSGDELDGPRGRIYLIKHLLEGRSTGERSQLHLDRCLTCRACETTCPSGVQYGKLADIGRKVVAERVARSVVARLRRWLLSRVLPNRSLFGGLFALARALRFMVPRPLAQKLPVGIPAAGVWPPARHARRMLVHEGCVQPAMAPDIDAAAARVLDRLGISLLRMPGAGCCGALRFHLDYQSDGLDDMRRLIDAWWPLVERGEIEAIVSTASGCGVTVKEYAHHLSGDPAYRAKASAVSALARDISEVVAAEKAALRERCAKSDSRLRSVVFQSPCTLQHGQRLSGVVEDVLGAAGFELLPVRDAHLCCGSAGTYSLLQPEWSESLRTAKLYHLGAGKPSEILTANIGCLSHLSGAAMVPVRHWIVALDQRFAECEAESDIGAC